MASQTYNPMTADAIPAIFCRCGFHMPRRASAELAWGHVFCLNLIVKFAPSCKTPLFIYFVTPIILLPHVKESKDVIGLRGEGIEEDSDNSFYCAVYIFVTTIPQLS